MIEREFQKILIEGLKKGGALVKNEHGDRFSSGWPDLYVLHPIFHGHIELKCGHKLTLNQILIMNKIEKQGVPAIAAYLNGRMVTFKRTLENGQNIESQRSLHICEGLPFLKFLGELNGQ